MVHSLNSEPVATIDQINEALETLTGFKTNIKFDPKWRTYEFIAAHSLSATDQKMVEVLGKELGTIPDIEEVKPIHDLEHAKSFTSLYICLNDTQVEGLLWLAKNKTAAKDAAENKAPAEHDAPIEEIHTTPISEIIAAGKKTDEVHNKHQKKLHGDKLREKHGRTQSM